MVLPIMLVLFIPIFFGLHELYPWARPEEVASEKVLRERHVYQNSWAYIVRGVFFEAPGGSLPSYSLGITDVDPALPHSLQPDLGAGVRRADSGIGGIPGQVVQPQIGEERR